MWLCFSSDITQICCDVNGLKSKQDKLFIKHESPPALLDTFVTGVSARWDWTEEGGDHFDLAFLPIFGTAEKTFKTQLPIWRKCHYTTFVTNRVVSAFAIQVYPVHLEEGGGENQRMSSHGCQSWRHTELALSWQQAELREEGDSLPGRVCLFEQRDHISMTSKPTILC